MQHHPHSLAEACSLRVDTVRNVRNFLREDEGKEIALVEEVGDSSISCQLSCLHAFMKAQRSQKSKYCMTKSCFPNKTARLENRAEKTGHYH